MGSTSGVLVARIFSGKKKKLLQHQNIEYSSKTFGNTENVCQKNNLLLLLLYK